MAAGLPVVATRVGGLPEAVVPEDTGFLVNPRDVAGLTESLARLLDDPEGRRSLGRRGRERVLAQFSFEAMVSRHQDVWARLLQRKKSNRSSSATADMTSPRIAYILLWFPEPTQTFILDEVNTMAGLGLDLTVHTLYGPRPPQRLSRAWRRFRPRSITWGWRRPGNCCGVWPG